MRKAGDIVTALFREQFGDSFVETARSTAGLFSSWSLIVSEVWSGNEQRRSFESTMRNSSPGVIPENNRFESSRSENTRSESAAEGSVDIPAAAVHSRIRELERGVLLVEVDHPGWIQIFQTKQGVLLSAVQRRYPELDIRGIAFRLSREPFVKA